MHFKSEENYMHYKVVIRRNGELFSCIIPYGGTYLGRKYVPNEWIIVDDIAIKNGLGLMVFDSFIRAEDFMYTFFRFQESDSYEIWKCEIKPFPENIEIKPYGISPNYYHIDDTIGDLYERCKHVDEEGHPSSVRIISWPFGTVFASEVKLIEKVPSEMTCDSN